MPPRQSAPVQAADAVSLVPVREVGGSGHAGLYGWGVAYDPTDNTMLVGDYWNFRWPGSTSTAPPRGRTR